MEIKEYKKGIVGLPIKDIDLNFWKQVFSKYLIHTIIFIILSFLLCYFFQNELSISLVFMVGGFGYGLLYLRIKSQFIKEFGKSIGFSYLKVAPISSVSGKLFSIGQARMIIDVLSGIYENISVRIFTYFFQEIGEHSGRHFYTVFEASLLGTVPNIFLYSNKQKGLNFDWNNDNSTIVLEGDFNKYFTLCVPKGYEQEAYEIFTPDVMANLIDLANELNFEFIGNKLYIYKTQLVTKKSEIERIFNLSKYLINLFHKNTANIKI